MDLIDRPDKLQQSLIVLILFSFSQNCEKSWTTTNILSSHSHLILCFSTVTLLLQFTTNKLIGISCMLLVFHSLP